MSWLKQLLGRTGGDAAESTAVSNDPRELLENNFNVMFIPAFHIFGDGDCLQWKYPYDNAHPYTCLRNNCPGLPFDTRFCLQCMRSSKCVLIEMRGLGTFVFTDHPHSDLFLILQRAFQDVTCYVFCGNDTGGYFKILQNGKIQRKIASFLCMDGIRNYPETRGAPCAYELETGRIFRVDPKAATMAEMLTGFTKDEVRALFDCYIGLEQFQRENIERVLIYSLI